MNRNFLKIKKYFDNLGDRDPNKSTLRPDRDWSFMVGIFLLATLFVAASNYLMFGSYTNVGDGTEMVSSTSTPEVVKLNTDGLKIVVSNFGEKAKSFDKYLSEKQTIGDPAK